MRRPWPTGGAVAPKKTQQTREIKSRNAVARAAFNKETLFNSKVNLNLRKNLVKW
jgi:hypothetical protein